MLRHLVYSTILSAACLVAGSTMSHADISMRPNGTWYHSSNLGVYCVYSHGTKLVPQTLYSDGSVPEKLDDLADGFNAIQFAKDLHEVHASYVVFTGMPEPGHLFYPSDYLGQYGKQYSTKRDVIADLISALKPYDIKLVLEMPIIDGSLLSPAEQAATGWNSPAKNYAVWNSYVDSIFNEIGARFGPEIAGYWLDKSGPPEALAKLDRTNLEISLLAFDPDRIVLGMAGDSAASLLKDGQFVDPPETGDITQWPPAKVGTAIKFTKGELWASLPPDTIATKYKPEDVFRYIVLEASYCHGGGALIEVSPYAGAQGDWERGVSNDLKSISKWMRPIDESLDGVSPSEAYPTAAPTTLGALPDGFLATESADGSTQYIHVLTPPQGRVVQLPVPADGSKFITAALLKNRHVVTLAQTSAGVTLTLPPSDSWDSLDTVIKLVRS